MRTSTRGALVSAMIAAVAAVAVLASLDADREDARALADFAGEQATLARALGAVVQVAAKAGASGTALASAVVAVPRPAGTVVLVRPAGATSFSVGGAATVLSAPVDDGFRRGAQVVRLSRPEAASLGL